MQLEYELLYNATLKDPVVIGAGPYGTRVVRTRSSTRSTR